MTVVTNSGSQAVLVFAWMYFEITCLIIQVFVRYNCTRLNVLHCSITTASFEQADYGNPGLV